MKFLIKRWENKHSDKVRMRGHNYRARKRNAYGCITAGEWKALKRKYNNICLCCGRDDVKLTLDHIIPLSKGGSNVIENAQPLCLSCNSSKGAKIIDYRRGYL